MCGDGMNRLMNNSGFGLVELAVMIIIIGVLTAVAMQSVGVLIQDARKTATEREMEMLAHAITGDPSVVNNGRRADFGYVGDVGSFPPDLQALYQNPGGYATWDGPYLPPGIVEDATGFRTDQWGSLYAYSGGVTIQSTGSGMTITHKIADAVSDYTLNSLNGTIKDANGSEPGVIYMDSVAIIITIPNGSGGTTVKSYTPDADGLFTIDSLPVGTHPLKLIYTPNADTLLRYVTILPRHKSPVSFKFASAYFAGGGGSGGLEYVPGSANTQTGKCNRFEFDITNTTGADITVTSMELIWTTPTAYYKRVKFDGGDWVFNSDNPRASSGQTIIFSNPKVVAAGATITIRVDKFSDVATGDGNKVDSSNTDMTAEFSDGSVGTFNTVACN